MPSLPIDIRVGVRRRGPTPIVWGGLNTTIRAPHPCTISPEVREIRNQRGEVVALAYYERDVYGDVVGTQEVEVATQVASSDCTLERLEESVRAIEDLAGCNVVALPRPGAQEVVTQVAAQLGLDGGEAIRSLERLEQSVRMIEALGGYAVPAVPKAAEKVCEIFPWEEV